MRNFVSSVLPPGTQIVIPLDPPISAEEKSYVVTTRGSETAHLDESNPFLVKITNPSKKVAPILFFVGPKSAQTGARNFLEGLLKKLLPG